MNKPCALCPEKRVRLSLRIIACLGLILVASSPSQAQTVIEVTDFGSNPGELRMFKHVPRSLPANSPLVVALHGCTQTASDYANGPGWVQLSDQRGFALLLPEQRIFNHPNRCFHWYQDEDTRRGSGEARSIKQMIEKMIMDHSIDCRRVYITGLSAGGAMTAVMLATYPEVFAAGAIVAGIPYNCADDSYIATTICMNPGRNMSPEEWGAMVKSASPAKGGKWPRVSIWHGSADTRVASMNLVELVDQWTDVHGIDQIPDGEDSVHGHAHHVYKNDHQETLVETYIIANMGHGTPVSPGAGPEQCGDNSIAHMLDAGICSSHHIAQFFSLVPLNAPNSRVPEQEHREKVKR